MQLFSADTTIFLKKFNNFFALENKKKIPQKLLIISPNIIFCFIKMAPCATSIYIMTLAVVK